MTDHASWHDQDAFWALMEPVLFNHQRLASAEAEVEKIAHLLPLAPGDRILDLCCGVGRHSLACARQGWDVVGVDRTARYIEQARQAAAHQDLSVEFSVGDMRDYRTPARFDVVLNLFGSFGYFDDPADNGKVVENAYTSLRPGGRFLIETMGKEILARDFQVRDWFEGDDLLVLSEKTVCHHWGRINTRWIVIQDGQRKEHRVSLHSYSAVELSSLLQDGGFPTVQVYGNLDGTPYDQAAQRLVVVGYK